MPAAARKILYWSLATEPVYDINRAELPPDCELVTLPADTEAARRDRIADAEVVIVAGSRLPRPMIEAAGHLRLVHHQGVGYHDTVDVAALAERGIPLALTPAGTTIGVAEHTVMLIIATMKHLTFADAELRCGRWHVNRLRPASRELFGRTIGYVGMGRIGQAVAERLCAFGTSGLYVDDAAPLSDADTEALNLRRVDLDTLLREADVVTLHVPLTPATRHLIDAAAIARMKPGAVLINTARGGIIDEAALFDALQGGHLGGAGLDVFETEPPPADHPLLTLPNVVLTPHISAGTRDALQTKMRSLFANVSRFYAGEPLHDQVDLNAGR